MLIKSLMVRNFRNLHDMETHFSGGLNVIYGRNGQGKTNLLEAIYLLVTGRSFRTTNESELIPWNVSEYPGTLVRALVQKSAGEEQLVYFFDGKNKRVLVDGKPIARLAHLVGRLNAVLFTPSDLLLVRGAPGLRRRFLDIAIGQTDRLYMDSLQEYQQVLRNRNAMLKQITLRGGAQAKRGEGDGTGVSPEVMTQLDVYDQQLAAAGAVIMKARQGALEEISLAAAEDYHKIALQDEERLELSYLPDVPLCAGGEVEEFSRNLLQLLKSSRGDDLRRLATLRGPHRDDFEFRIKERPARQFASQGQQRSAVLALKSAEMQYLFHHTGERPLLMLDDVISELDTERKAAFLDTLGPEVQTFITTTDPDTVTAHVKAEQLLRIADGKLA